MTRRTTCILHSINPEIDRTYHRLVRQNRTLDTNFVSVSEHLVAENTVSEHSVYVYSEYSASVHSIAFPDFDYSVHSENMAQLPTPLGPHERTLRESIIDAASGGALGDMTPFEARCLIEKVASNSQQFNARSGDAIVVIFSTKDILGITSGGCVLNLDKSSSFLLFVMLVSSSKPCHGQEQDLLHNIDSKLKDTKSNISYEDET
ncbi:hypothetical protein Lal_00046393 [Lupinus albus]|nr:hypothetical protein Lal_00046393 [Lupinus albus]